MPCSTEPCIVGKTYEIRKPAPNLRDSRWMNYVPIEKRNKMSRPFKSLVVETVFQLCSRNDDLEKSGVTHKQLHTVLSLRLSRGTSPALITALIEKEIHSKTIVKNSLGNYSMNPDLDDMDSLLVPEESSSDSNPEVKDKNMTAEQTVDSSDVTASQKSQMDEKSIKEEGESDKMELEEEEEPDKPVRKQRRRRTRKPRVVVVEPDEPETPERSPSPSQQQTKRTGRSVLVTNSNGRRIIRKITKYDPSEFYMTPLIRKKTKGVVEEPKVKLKRGRPSLKAKLAAAAAAAALASTTSAPLKKFEQIRRETKTSKQAGEPSKSPATKTQPTPPIPQLEPKDEVDEGEEPEVTESWVCQQSNPVKSSASMLKNECYLCSKLANVNDDKETLACSLCLNIAHNKCVVDDSFYKELKKWRCSECLISDPVICSVCDKEYKKSGGAMVMCDFCEEMFHVNCHDPPVKLPISSFSWRCSLCPQISITDALIGGREDLRSTVGTYAFTVVEGRPSLSACGGPACLPTPVLPPEPSMPVPQPAEETQQQETQLKTHPPQHQPFDDPVTIKTEPPDEVEEIKEEEIDDVPPPPPSYKFHRPGEPIPKVDDWTAKEVADYFSERFGPMVGNAFLSQEIDGKSLKLMRRNDVTEQLGLQFGIALKVLYYVKKIQLNTNVIQELWA